MRDIKFRAWSPIDKVMLKNPTLTVHRGVVTESNLEIMQFTGLKDKNGVEIYEGDILKDVNHMQSEVEWGRYAWKPWSHILNVPYAGYPPFSNPEECVEVIGNIYENQELLKGK